MKKSSLFLRLSRLVILLAFFMLQISLPGLHAQDTVFATNQTNAILPFCHNCSVQNPNGSISSDRTDYTTLSMPYAGSEGGIKQTLIFYTSPLNHYSTKIVIRIRNNSILSLVRQREIRVQTFLGSSPNNDSQPIDSVDTRLSPDSLEARIELSPRKPYDRVEVYISSPDLNPFLDFRIYYAFYYYRSNKTYATGETHNIQPPCLLCSVQNPGGAVGSSDFDYSSLNLTTSLLGGAVKQKLIFHDRPISHINTKVVIQVGNAAGLSVKLLGNVSVQSFSGAVANNDKRKVDSLDIQLNTDATQATIEFLPLDAFDRVEISLNGGLLGVLGNLRIYYAYDLWYSFSECATIPPDPLFYCRFDGDLIDQVTFEDHTTNAYGRFTDSGMCRQSRVPGSLDFQDFNPFTNPAGRSFSIWCMAADTSIEKRIGMWAGDLLFNDTSIGGVHKLSLSNQTITGETASNIQYTFSSGDWFQVIGTYGYRDTLRLYVNGVLVGKTKTGPLPPDETATAQLGGNDGIYIDEFLLYDRELSEEEITTYYESYFEDDSITTLQAVVNRKVDVPVIASEESLVFYPNPSVGTVQIKSNINLEGSSLVLINNGGQALYKTILSSSTILFPTAIPAGVYIVQLTTKNKKIYHRKLVLVR